MTTITYDPSTDPDAIAAAEERDADSIRVGEQLEQAEAELLAGKYRSAEDLEQAYLELQSRFSAGERGAPEAEEAEDTEEGEEEEDDEGSLFDTLFAEFSEYGQLTQETAEELQNLDPVELVEQILAARPEPEAADLSEEEVGQLQSIAGGTEAYQAMTSWAAENLSEGEVDAFNNVMGSGNVDAIFFAIQALKAAYLSVEGSDGELLQGRASTSGADVFRSQAEVVRAMNDPRYDADPAYRNDVMEKLERSTNLEF
jgi:hypothetical protein